MEQIYTIPVNESFENCQQNGCDCPLCKIYDNLEKKEIDMALGPAMMEPDTRIEMNKHGFCREHFGMLLEKNNRLSLALILDMVFGGKANKSLKNAKNMVDSCFICNRIDSHFEKMVETVILLYAQDPDFKEKLRDQKYFCLPHYAMLLECAKNKLDKKKYSDFFKDISFIEDKYFDKIIGDVSWFCKKFDYRYDSEPWYDSKDAPERAVRLLTGGVGKSK